MESPTGIVEPRQAADAAVPDLVKFLAAYSYLLEACKDAKEEGLEPRQRLLGYSHLREAGAGADTLQWMQFQGHVEHFERDEGGWGPRQSAVPDARSVYALTPLGEAFAEILLCLLLMPETEDEFDWAWGMLQVGRLAPRYDAEHRLLSWGRHALKSYRQPSGNQETILLAAEELAWPDWFDDPLPRARSGNPKVRLHDAIKLLNRHQCEHLVQFKGDGTGRRVGWELR
jgi:hypothetical protein